MIDWLVFSRDRALQLDGLLTSFDQYAAHLQQSVTVLYRATKPLHELAYLDCAKAHSRQMFWRQEGDFAEDVFEWIEDRAGYYVGFLVDDDLFIRPAPPVETVRPQAGEACFALRLWTSITRVSGNTVIRSWPHRAWPWRTSSELDYGYPLALDGHVYRRDTISPLLDFDFADPTQLEAGLAARADRLTYPLMAAAERQCLVGIPANRVSENSGVPHMGGDVDELCERFLAGDRLDPDAMGLDHVASAHAEISLAFRR